MGCTAIPCYEDISETNVITSSLLKSILSKCKKQYDILYKEKLEQINKQEEEIINLVKQKNIETANAKLDELIINEDFILIYDILTPIILEIKEKSPYIIQNDECPNDMRSSLDTLIYSTTRLDIKELTEFRKKIKQKYGASYIEKADKNLDQFVNNEIINKFKGTVLNEDMKKIKIINICNKKGVNVQFGGVSPYQDWKANPIPTDINGSTNAENKISVNKILGDTVQTQVYRSNNSQLNNNNININNNNNPNNNNEIMDTKIKNLFESETIYKTKIAGKDNEQEAQQKNDNNNIDDIKTSTYGDSKLLRIPTVKTVNLDQDSPQINITDKKIQLLRIGTSETVNLENKGLPFTYDNNDALLEANNQSMNSSIANPNGSANPYEGTF